MRERCESEEGEGERLVLNHVWCSVWESLRGHSGLLDAPESGWSLPLRPLTQIIALKRWQRADNNRLCSSLRLISSPPSPGADPHRLFPSLSTESHHRGRAAVVFHFLCLHGARIVSPDLCFWTAGCGCVMPRWVLDGSWCYLCVYFFLLPLVVCHRTDALIRYLRYVSDIGLLMFGILFPL